MIREPVAKTLSMTKCAFIMAMIFVSAVSSVIMQIKYLHFEVEGQYSGCWLFFGFDVGFTYWLLFTIMQMFIPMVVLIVVYTLAALKLVEHQKKFKTMGVDDHEFLKRMRQDRHIIWMFAVIITIFFLLNAPYSCFIVAQYYILRFDFDSFDRHAGDSAQLLLFALSAASSVVNPLVYSKMHMEISGSLKICYRRVFFTQNLENSKSESLYSHSDATEHSKISRCTSKMLGDVQNPEFNQCCET